MKRLAIIWFMWLILTIFMLFIVVLNAPSKTKTQIESRGVAIWDSHCIHISERTYAEAPLDSNGEPVWNHVVVNRIIVDKNCYRYEIKKDKDVNTNVNTNNTIKY
jgi:hypothetical protein